MKIWLFITCTISFVSFSIFGQINELGKPFLINYSTKVYQANEQNWAAIQDNRGVMYFGNTNGILEYDGKNWSLIPVANNSIVRSLAIDSMGVIYVGAVNEFGFLEPNESGEIVYKSLSVKLDSAIGQFADVWKTYTIKDEIYFCSFTKVFLYKNDTIRIIELPEESFFSYLVNDKLFVSNIKSGLMEIKQNTKDNIITGGVTVELSKGGEHFAGKHILGIIQKQKSELIIGTFGLGLFGYNETTGISTKINYNIQKLDASDYLSQYNLFHVIDLQAEYLALATYQKGLIICNYNSKISTLIDKSFGLQDETLTYVFNQNNNKLDDQLWVTLARGISRIETYSPIRVFEDQILINDIIMFDNVLYQASDFGIKYMTFDENKLPVFSEVDGTRGQTWSFLNFQESKNDSSQTNSENSLLLASTGAGVVSVKNKSIKRISEKYDCRILYQSQIHQNKVYIGLNGGLAILEFVNGNWVDKGVIKGFNDIIMNITEDNNGDLWLGTYYNGILKIGFPDTTMTRYNISHGLPSNKENSIYNISGKLIIATKKGFYSFNEEEQKFFPTDYFNDKYSNSSTGIFRLFKNQFEEYWIIAYDENKQWISKLISDEDGSFNIIERPLKRMPNMSYQNIYTDKNHITWIAGADGLFSYNNNYAASENTSYNALIRKVTVGQGSIIFSGTNYYINEDGIKRINLTQSEHFKPVLPYSENSISFEYSAPFFIEENSTLYSHKLKGFDKTWTKWTTETKAVFTNLNQGDYSFEIKAKNIYNVESTIARYDFSIKPPWYQTIIAYFIYLILFIFSIRFLIKYNTRRLEKEKLVLERIVKRRTAEIVKQKEEIEKAYENVKMLSEIGQDVTANLSVEKIVEIVYRNVNKLLDASIFAIGLYNEDKKVLDFLGKESVEGELLRNIDSLDNENLLSVKCFLNQNEIVINNFSKGDHEYKYFRSDPNFKVRESLIYLPLTTKENRIGIITVQSLETQKYTDYHVNMLRNLAVYTAIALDNAEAYEQIESQKEEIERQRDIVVKQKEEITDSILYAKRIQNAVLPPIEFLREKIPEHFVLFKPRDIVSGDFYWMKQINNFIVLTVADCTGHGVPGAFMSMLGIALLNEIVRKKTVNNASDVLNELRQQVKLSLRQTGKTDEAKDGMDIALCVIDLYSKKLNFAGAYNPLYLFRKSNSSGKPFTSNLPVLVKNDKYQLIEIKADKMPIGIHLKEKESFTNHEFDILDGDTIYLFSDGFADQFGGERRKKFMTKPFKKLLLEIQDENMQKQKDILDKTIEDWRNWPDENGNSFEQIDDISVIGIRL